MAANQIPRYIRVGVHKTVDFSVANTNLDGTTGTYVTVHTGATEGSVIDVLGYKFTQTTTQGRVRWFIDDRLFIEQDVAAVTPSASQDSAEAFLDKSDATHGAKFPIHLESGSVLKMSTEKGETGKAFAQGGDY